MTYSVLFNCSSSEHVALNCKKAFKVDTPYRCMTAGISKISRREQFTKKNARRTFNDCQELYLHHLNQEFMKQFIHSLQEFSRCN